MRNKIFASLIVLCAAVSPRAQGVIPAEMTASIDKSVTDMLAKTGAPSAAVVEGGKLAYANAYGAARLEPKRKATAEMHYNTGSISKQFTTATNDVSPDEQVAVAVFTNMDATTASQQIASKIESIVFVQNEPGIPKALANVKSIFASLRRSRLDRFLCTANANARFTDEAIADFAAALGPLGSPQDSTQSAQFTRGGMTLRRYEIKFADEALRLTTFIVPDGKIEGYQISIAE